jgi:dihydrofolate reductase
MISLIAAMDRNRNIGLNGDMPWGKEMKSDLRRFKELTEGHLIIMGRKTFESLPGVLPKRHHIVVTSDKSYLKGTFHPTVHVVHDIETAVHIARMEEDEESFVIGGAQIYEQFLPYADKIYLTKILANLEGDTKFPCITGSWDIAQGMLFHKEGEPYGTQYITYTRRNEDES